MKKPLNPDEVDILSISTELTETVNELLVLNWTGKKAEIKESEIRERTYSEDLSKISNIPSIYRYYGWEVTIETDANSSDSVYTFKKKGT